MVANDINNELKSITIYTDGGSRGNPGESGVGVVIKNSETGEILKKYKKYLGIKTNNQSEYTGAYLGLKLGLENFNQEGNLSKITLIMDSELVIKQLRGEYKIKNPELKKIYLDIQETLSEYMGEIEYIAVRREYNKEADELANMAMDELK